jgi:hypothetical protein
VATRKQKFPAKIGEAVDLFYTRRAERLAAQKVVDALKVEESALADHIINSFTKQEISGARGELATGAISESKVPAVKDFDKTLAWIVKKKFWHLLSRSVSTEGVRELWNNGVEVPGIESFTVKKLSAKKR